MVVCERPRYWRWLPKVLGNSIRKVPGVIGAICVEIRNPMWETIISGVATGIFLMLIVADLVSSGSYLNSTERVIITLLTIPSFLIMMHGIYRGNDC